MKNTRLILNQALVLLLLLLSFHMASGQNIQVKGVVVDKTNNQPLAYVNVFVPSTNFGTMTDDNGNFEFYVDPKYRTIQFSYLGYQTIRQDIAGSMSWNLKIKMVPESNTLKEVEVTNQKEKYRNKDNPAVELIRKVIEHRDSNRIKNYNYVQYQEYEKIQLALSNTPSKLRKNILVKRYAYLGDNIDTTKVDGKGVLTVYMHESLADMYMRKDPQASKKIVRAEKQVDFQTLFDNKGIKTYLKHVYQDIDIYNSNIMVMTNEYLSPISNLSPTFYKFFILDTVEIDQQKLVELYFTPRNKRDFLFDGKMYVTLDGHYAVRKLDMGVNKNSTLNWVNDLRILQTFDQNPDDGRFHLSKSSISTNFGLLKNSSSTIFGERSVSFKDYKINTPISDSIFNGPAEIESSDATKHDNTFWETARHDSLTGSEKNVYENMEKLQNTKSFKRTMEIASLFLLGYVKASPYVEIGPFNTFYSFNPPEGFRLRIGGRTTPAFSKHIYLENYTAYGFKDDKWKYYIGGSYSFTGKSIYEFPIKRIDLNYQKDTKIPGQELQFIQEDNILLSFKRGVNDKWLYNDIYNISYLQEFNNHLSYRVFYKNWRQEPTSGLIYTYGEGNNVKDITTSEAGIELRWAPKEEFYQGKLYRIPMPNKHPIITLRANFGIKGFLNGQYEYQSYSLNVYKRFYLSQVGFTDLVLESGYIAGKVPFPLLFIHRANQSYAYQLQSYNLMNFLEFVSDRYLALNIDHCFSGFFVNKIPLINRLKLREFVTLKVLYGNVRDENQPSLNNDQFKFPVDQYGRTSTYTLHREPYIEGSVGLGNIFNLLRVDVVRRFTYLTNQNVSEWGIRARVKFDF